MARATAFSCLKKGHASWKNESFQPHNVLYVLFLSKTVIIVTANEPAEWAGKVYTGKKQPWVWDLKRADLRSGS